MPKLHHIRKLSVLFVICLLPVYLPGQSNNTYASHNKPDIRIKADTIITENTFLELFGSQMSISKLAFSGDILLYSDSSLVRIILTDSKYNDYLIYEAYPILSGYGQFSLNEVAEETNILDQITPYRVKIELVDASVLLKEFIIGQKDIYQAERKGASMLQQNKIDRINRNLQKLGQPWLAGETAISSLSFQEKKSIFGDKVPNFQGFEYYVGGVFVLPGAICEVSGTKGTRSEHLAGENSQYPGEFSWQDRHGTDWITPVKDQTACNSCYAFGNAAATETLVNLYFNRHLDYDLSEQNIVSCTEGSCKVGSVEETLDFIMEKGIVPEDCFPYTASDQACSDICNNPGERIKIANWESHHKEKDFKKEIISGAAAAEIFSWHHCMQIIGYKVLEAGDYLYFRQYDDCSYVAVEQNSELVGQTAWLCKNSWGESWGNNGLGYFIADIGNTTLYSLQGHVESMILNESDVRCTDHDGDGHYYWGIGPKPAHCPDCPDIPDGDDSDPCIGPSDEFGNLKSITPTPEGNDSIILLGSPPDLYISGSNIHWYKDEELKKLLHEGEHFKTGHTLPGKYTYYVTQTIGACESEAIDISLSILHEVPRPKGQDTTINIREKALLSVKGEADAIFSWYEDSSLNILAGRGELFEAVKADTGIYTYYVTQTLGSLESNPDTVLLTLINYNSVPDTAFLYALIDKGVDTNNDGIISNEEAEAISKLDVSGNEISDMTGIEAFINLEVLDCSNNTGLRMLDLSNNPALTSLNCNNNRLAGLKISNNPALTHLNCNDNRLYNLNIKNNPALVHLNCSGNFLALVDFSNNPELTHLNCSNNLWLWKLELLNNPALTELNCGINRLSRLDLSNNVILGHLNCSYNMLYSLDVSNKGTLSHLECHGNRISGLNISGETALNYLNCAHNNLAKLDISNNTAIEYLHCGGNNLSSLDISNNIALSDLGIADMPALNGICVWGLPFPPAGVHIERSGSPNVYFTTNCSSGSDNLDNTLNRITIHPNPTNFFLNVESNTSGIYEVYILSISGKLLSSYKFEGTGHKVDLSSFRKGVYIINVRSEDFAYTRKIVKL